VPHSKIFQFLARLLLFYVASATAWLFLHPYYEALLWFISIQTSQVLGQPAFTNPQIVGNAYYYRLGNATFVYDSIAAITLTVLITLPLLLASSGFSLLQRAQIVFIGILLLFAFHVLSLLIGLHANLYSQHHSLVQKGVNIEQSLPYNALKAQLFNMVNRFFNVILKFVIAVCIWMGLVSYYKRSLKQRWMENLF